MPIYINDDFINKNVITENGKEITLYDYTPTVVDTSCYASLGFHCKGARSYNTLDDRTIGNYTYNLIELDSKYHLLPSTNTSPANPAPNVKVNVDVSVDVGGN